MKDYRFYLEFATPSDKRRGEHNGNVVAAIIANGIQGYGSNASYEAIGAVYHSPNSPVCGTSASLEYLRDNCKRISEEQAREIHPQLFVYLEESDFFNNDEEEKRS